MSIQETDGEPVVEAMQESGTLPLDPQGAWVRYFERDRRIIEVFATFPCTFTELRAIYRLAFQTGWLASCEEVRKQLQTA